MTPRETLYAHQVRALAFAQEREFYALLMEQRTGKTAVEILDSARRFEAGEIDALLVCAPNGVQSNWILREIPRHMPSSVPAVSAAWYAGPLKADRVRWEALMNTAGRTAASIMAINWEALITRDGFAAARDFCKKHSGRLKIIGDESQRIKSMSAARTKAFFKLKRFSRARSIMTGTPILNSPWDAFSQFSFLEDGLLGTTSFAAFRAEYAELMPPEHGLMRHIGMRIRPQVEARFKHIANEEERERLIVEELQKRLPKVVKRDPISGLPMWRNVERLERLISAHSFRVLRKDCMDLPPKIYARRYFRMTTRQREAYELLRDEFRLQLLSGELTAVERIAAFTKLSQVTSGYFLPPGEREPQWLMPREENPKLGVLAEEIETTHDAGKPMIIWARFHVELSAIADLLQRMGISCVQYHGESGSKTQRIEAIDRFQSGGAEVFLSQQRSGGVGLTLNAGKAQIYFSNSFSLEDRLQSEDRPEGIGQTESVEIVDLLAEDSIDVTIVDRLQQKIDLASLITGDTRRALELIG